MALEQVGWAEVAAKDIQVASGGANFTQKKHEDELTLVFDKISFFQEGVLQHIPTVMDRVDNMDDSTLTGFTYQGSSQMEDLVEQI